MNSELLKIFKKVTVAFLNVFRVIKILILKYYLELPFRGNIW